MITGMVWSVKTTSMGVMSQLIRLIANPKISVEPVYEKAHFSTEGKFHSENQLWLRDICRYTINGSNEKKQRIAKRSNWMAANFTSRLIT